METNGFEQSPESGRPGWVAWGFLLYFSLHIGVRLLLPESLELDEAEQVVLAQDWRWTYGAQHPPVYTWVQRAAFDVFGVGIFPLALVKNLWLFLTFWFLYQAGREVTGNGFHALLVSATTFFIPQFMWEVYRDLTHSLAVSACAAGALWVLLRLRRRPSAWGYVGLGVIVGVGLLSKINFVILLGALVVASLLVRSFRAVLLDHRIVLAAGTSLLIVAWPLAAALKLGLDPRAVAALGDETWWHGAWSLIKAAAEFLAPGLALYWLISWRIWPWRGPRSDVDRWLGIVMVVALCGCLVGAVFKGMYFKDRLLLPLLMAWPVWLVCRSNLPTRQARRLMMAGAAVGVGVLLALPASTWISSQLGHANRRAAPFVELASSMRDRYGEPTVIVAEDRWIAGNLLLSFPGSVVEAPEASLGLAQPGGRWLVVWDLEQRDQPGSGLKGLAEKLSGRVWQWDPLAELSAPYLYSPNERMRLGTVVWEGTDAVPRR